MAWRASWCSRECRWRACWLAWTAGLRTRVDTWGPPPLKKMTRLFFEMNATDIETRIADEGRSPLVPLVHVHELVKAGPVMQDENLKVTAAPTRLRWSSTMAVGARHGPRAQGQAGSHHRRQRRHRPCGGARARGGRRGRGDRRPGT